MAARTKPDSEDPNAEPPAPDATVVEEQPATGGSFVRSGDGSLTCVTPPPRDAAESETKDAAAPAVEKQD